MSEKFDAIVIGAGQAGPPLVGRLVASGMKVAIVERNQFGGTCVNTGCMPTKTMIASARVAHLARRAADYGVTLSSAPTIDLARVQARRDKVTMDARGGLESFLGGMDGCTMIRGHARFISSRELAVGDRTLTADKIFINVGTRPNVPPMPGLDRVSHLTNSSLLKLNVLPKHLVVIGGSYIGLEFAQMYRRFGCEVTVVEMADRLVQREDEDVSDEIARFLEAEGIHLRLSATCISFEPHADGVAVGVDCASGDRTVVGSHVLLAIGRKPNTDDLGLEAAGVEVDSRGIIQVDDQLRTSVEGIWALGDCNGKGAFTHTAYNDFEIVAANLLDDGKRRVSQRIPAYALYTDPPLGRVGLTEREARQKYKSILVGKRPMTRVGRAVENGETSGFIKFVVDGETRKILGAAVLGIGGDEVIHGVIDTMAADVPYTVLQDAVPIHPTVSELLPTVLGGLRAPEG